MKILIAVPCVDQVPTPFCQSLAQLEKIGECALMMKSGALIYHSRDAMAATAIQHEFDYVMWFDSDMVFPADVLIRLMNTMKEKNLDIVSGLYFRRVPPYTPVLFDKLELNGEDADFTEFKEIPDELFEVGACGFGCVLVKTDVFFDVQSTFRQMFAPIGKNGEDVAFCWRARQCGYKVYCDPSIDLGHVGYSIVDGSFFNAFKK